MKNILIKVLIFFVYIILPVLISISEIFFEYKFYILIIVSFLMYCVLKNCKYKNTELGLTFKNSIKSIKDVTFISLILITLGVIIYLLDFSRFDPSETLFFYFMYLFLLSPAQEFLYRGVLTSFLIKNKANKLMIILIPSLLYSYVHIIYFDVPTLLLTFVIGIIWQNVYIKTKNLIGVSISHSILGALTIFIGLIN